MNKGDMTLRSAITSADNFHGVKGRRNLMEDSNPKGYKVCTVKLQQEIEKSIFTGTGNVFSVLVYYVKNTEDKVYSMVMRYLDKGVILIEQERTHCWQRFCKAKELCHLFSDTEENFSLKSRGLMDAVLQGRAANYNDPDEPLHPEAFAFYMALEIMISWEDSRSKMIQMEKEKQSPYFIALALGVPEVLLTSYFLNGSTYGKLSASLRGGYI